jgi:hypothetical protein
VPLVRHLNFIELQMERGGQRKGGDRHSTAAGHTAENQRLSERGNVAVRSVAEEAVVALYLDRQLSWPRVRKLIRSGHRPDAMASG